MTLEEAQALIEELQDEKTALKTKNSELLSKNCKLRDDLDAAKEAADHSPLEAQIKTLTDERDAALKSVETSQRDALLANTFAAHNVLPDAADLIKDAFSGKIVFKDGEAMIGDEKAADHLASYFKSDKAKAFIAPTGNSGVGAKAATAKAPAASGEWSLDAFNALRGTDPSGAAAWALASGHGYLNNI